MLAANNVVTANKDDIIKGGGKLIEKSIELTIGKLLKSQKLSKSQKSAKLRKKSSKIENISNFDAKKNEQSFLTPKAKAIFNRL